ncbi:MAG: hypothetical protein JSR59_04000 [Proteobacteria bacterium]|nr:hypothetical protein [Pseudomonadota bacterium]
MNFIHTLLAWAARVLGAAIVLVACVFVLLKLVQIVIPESVLNSLAIKLSGPIFFNAVFPKNYVEYRTNHQAITDMVYSCMEEKVARQLQPSVLGLLFPFDYSIGVPTASTAPSAAVASIPSSSRPTPSIRSAAIPSDLGYWLPTFEARTLQLSRNSSYAAMAADVDATNAYYLTQLGSLASILLGFLTTVVVGLNSIGQNSNTAPVPNQNPNQITNPLRIYAFILPALGTAVTAIIAFYDPNASLARNLQASTSLRQLQDDVRTSRLKAGCFTSPSGKFDQKLLDDYSSKLATWESKYQEIALTARTFNVPGTKSSGQDPKQ